MTAAVRTPEGYEVGHPSWSDALRHIATCCNQWAWEARDAELLAFGADGVS